jgi:hypothetical protein
VGRLCGCRFLRGQYAGSCSSLVKIHSQWRRLCGTIRFCSRQLALSNGVIVHPVSVVVSVEINRRHYFQSPPRTSHSNREPTVES